MSTVSGARVVFEAVLAAALALLVMILVVPSTAGAASYTSTCPALDGACLALSERLEAIVTELEAHGVVLRDIRTNTSPSGSPAPVSGVVALSNDDRQLLDLSARGVWMVGGLLLALIVAPLFVGAFRFWRE